MGSELSIVGVDRNGRALPEVFRDVVEQEAWEHGHGGYSGTLAEKHNYTAYEATVEVEDANIKLAIDALTRFVDEGHEETTREWGYGGSQTMTVWVEDYAPTEDESKALAPFGLDTADAIRQARQVVDDKWGPAVMLATPSKVAIFGYCSS